MKDERTAKAVVGNGRGKKRMERLKTVLDVKDTNKARIVTTDGCRIHIDPQWFRTRYFYSLRTDSVETFEGKQIVCGYTCMDHDRIMEIENEKKLEVGDEIVYHRVGAYTVTFGGMFIKFLPEVYVGCKGKVKKIRGAGCRYICGHDRSQAGIYLLETEDQYNHRRSEQDDFL